MKGNQRKEANYTCAKSILTKQSTLSRPTSPRSLVALVGRNNLDTISLSFLQVLFRLTLFLEILSSKEKRINASTATNYFAMAAYSLAMAEK